MQHTYYELYKNYYNTVLGRFYNKKQRRRLLNLFAAGCGLDPKSEEYRSVFQTADRLEEQEIHDAMDCKNFKLICRISGEDPMMILAVSALSACYDEYAYTQKKVYLGPVEWRSAVYTASPKTRENRLEIAYIEYANGKLESAVEGFRSLANEGNIAVIEHLCYILSEEMRSKEAAYYTALLQEIYTQYLKLEVPQWLEGYKTLAFAGLSAAEAKEIRTSVAKRAGHIVGEQARNMPAIGFLQSV